jgi:galactoside O-acetyltransferase
VAPKTEPLGGGRVQNYSETELRDLGIDFGDDVSIHKSVVFFGAEQIRIGSRVRIDCFSMLSAGPEGIAIGNNVHLAAGSYYLGGGGPIVIEDFAGLSARVTVFTASDDFKDGWLTGPTIPSEFTKLTTGPVTVRKHALVGAGTVIFANVTLGMGCSVGALSLIKHDVDDFTIVAGNPARVLGQRDQQILDREAKYLASL